MLYEMTIRGFFPNPTINIKRDLKRDGLLTRMTRKSVDRKAQEVLAIAMFAIRRERCARIFTDKRGAWMKC